MVLFALYNKPMFWHHTLCARSNISVYLLFTDPTSKSVVPLTSFWIPDIIGTFLIIVLYQEQPLFIFKYDL